MASEQPLFTLRPATTKDLPAIDVVADPEGMGPMPSADHITVAVNADDEVVGFLRLQEADGLWHVNPVAVYPTWRRFGVGQALMGDALAKTGELGLVARGPSVPLGPGGRGGGRRVRRLPRARAVPPPAHAQAGIGAAGLLARV